MRVTATGYGSLRTLGHHAGMDPVEITAGDLHLRPFRPSDAPAVHAACQDPDIQRWTRVPSPYTRQDAHAFIEEFAPSEWESGRGAVFAIVDATGGELLGTIGLSELDDPEGLAEIGYWMVPAARGRGVMTRAVGTVCRWAFAECGRERIEWLASVGNVASRRVAEKAGFTIEGTLRSRLVLRGRRTDAWIGGLLRLDVTG
jgi:RimJ/RimL family protein N-acetyltransferase